MALNSNSEGKKSGFFKKIGIGAIATYIGLQGANSAKDYLKEHPIVENPTSAVSPDQRPEQTVDIKSVTETYTVPTAGAQVTNERRSRTDSREVPKIETTQIPLLIEDWKKKLSPDYPLSLNELKDIINIEKSLEARNNIQLTEYWHLEEDGGKARIQERFDSLKRSKNFKDKKPNGCYEDDGGIIVKLGQILGNPMKRGFYDYFIASNYKEMSTIYSKDKPKESWKTLKTDDPKCKKAMNTLEEAIKWIEDEYPNFKI